MNLSEIKRIYIETHNTCNMCHYHVLCPTSLQEGNPKFLEKEIVENLLTELHNGEFIGNSFDKMICFHTYCEPLIDPRLFWFIHRTRELLPKSKIRILTNGKSLDQILLNELSTFINQIDISIYSKHEKERISKLKFNIPHNLSECTMQKELLEQYDSKDLHKTKPCYFGTSIYINCCGQVRMCCRDWKSRYIFGDLHNQKLKEIIESQNFNYERENLISGERNAALCAKCDCCINKDGAIYKA